MKHIFYCKYAKNAATVNPNKNSFLWVDGAGLVSKAELVDAVSANN